MLITIVFVFLCLIVFYFYLVFTQKDKSIITIHKNIKIPEESVVFNVDNFNEWFNDKDNGATYAHSGIFLRTDKLSDQHIEEYMKNCYGIDNFGPFYGLNQHVHWFMNL